MRAVVGCVSLLVCVFSLATVYWSTGSGAGPGLGTRTAAKSEQWQVLVDGWSLRFDGVANELSGLERLAGATGETEASTDFTSPLDPLIIRYATEAGLDWRFVSALIFEDSRSHPESQSEERTRGLMQVREIAAREGGEDVYHDPEDNIRLGVRYLKELEELFVKASGLERLGLMLAAYHMGPGHVRDAQTLATRFGYDPLRWYDSMERVVPLLEQRPISQELPNGCAKGRLTVRYVNRVLDRYSRYPRSLRSPREEAQSAAARG